MARSRKALGFVVLSCVGLALGPAATASAADPQDLAVTGPSAEAIQEIASLEAQIEALEMKLKSLPDLRSVRYEDRGRVTAQQSNLMNQIQQLITRIEQLQHVTYRETVSTEFNALQIQDIAPLADTAVIISPPNLFGTLFIGTVSAIVASDYVQTRTDDNNAKPDPISP